MRDAGRFSRVEYWAAIQGHLASAQLLAELIESGSLALSTDGGELVLAVTLEDSTVIRLSVDPSDMRSAAVTLVAEGRYEPLELRLMLAAARGAATFIDVGANAGLYSLAVAVANPKCQVTAFEPNKVVFERLLRNIGLSQLEERVTALNVGISSASRDKATLYVPVRTGSGGGSLVDLHPDEGPALQHHVSLVTLDEACEGRRPDLMKIDVEGAEMDVLAGGVDTIGESRPTLLIELLRKWMKPFGCHPRDVVEMLLRLDYRCYAIGQESVRATNEVNEDTQETNFLFVHPSRSGAVGSLLRLEPGT
jgi:FkbM family methyltransferase